MQTLSFLVGQPDSSVRRTVSFGRFAVSCCLLFGALVQIGCASRVKIHELNHPAVGSDLSDDILSPNKFSAQTRVTLAESRLSALSRTDRVEAIRALSARLSENPEDWGTRIALAELSENHASKISLRQPDAAIGFYLTAAEAAFPGLRQPAASKEYQSLVAIYNLSCAEVATLVFRSDSGLRVRQTIEGPVGSYELTTDFQGQGNADPHDYDEIHPASVLRIKGFVENHLQPGVGGALVGYQEGTEERREKDPFLSPFGRAEPFSATLEFSGNSGVELAYHDVLAKDQVRLEGKTFPLEADYTATMATLLAHEPAENIGWEGMVHPEDCLKYQGLFMLHEYQPHKIPVILVHGLMSSPDTWMKAVSELYADPVLRHRYQLLVYEYPTGFPIPHNAAGLRTRLKQWVETYDPNRRNPGTRQMVMIGHSMGGLLTSMQLRDGGDPIAYALHPEPIRKMDISDKHQEALQELVYFESNPDISRAIFVCAPHRGSDLSNGALGRLGNFLIKQSFQGFEGVGETLSGHQSELEDTILFQPTNGIDDLLAHSEVLETVVKLPVRNGITIHSIVGDRGKGGELEASSDGVVEYWSSHVDGAASEFVAGTSHTGATGDDGTVEEVRRILYLHAGERYEP